MTDDLKPCTMPEEILITALNKINKRYQGYAGNVAGKALKQYADLVTRPEPVTLEDAVTLDAKERAVMQKALRSSVKKVEPVTLEDACPEGFMPATGSDLFQALGKSKEDADSLERGVNAVMRRTDMASVTDNTSVTDDALREAVEYIRSFAFPYLRGYGMFGSIDRIETLITHALKGQSK